MFFYFACVRLLLCITTFTDSLYITHPGVGHLEALELLSKECVAKVSVCEVCVCV